jgi:hypothetical protein
MKKTIAKLMAAAMMLSAVPAVTLPSFVSKAAETAQAVTNTATATAKSQFQGQGQIAPTAKGEVFAFILPDNVAKENFKVAASSGNADVRSFVNVELQTDASNNKLVHVVASVNYTKMTSAQKTAYINAVKAGTNTFRVTLSRNRKVDDTGVGNIYNAGGQKYEFMGAVDSTIDLDKSDTTDIRHSSLTSDDKYNLLFNQTFVWTSEKEYRIGGVYENGKIRSGVADVDGYLMDRNVYATLDKVTSDGLAEVQLLKQDNNEANKLDKNDTLRGKKLILDYVWIGGAEYKVGKLGAQALKKAKMKKLQLKNCSKVGKGAMRECKQLKNVNLKDKNKVRKIHAKAFYKCKNLRSITIDARKLNVIGKDAFKGVKKACKVKFKASKSKYNDCVKKLKKSGAKVGTDVKVSRIAP